MKHKHDHCDHDLKHCDHCDVVYCTKCEREWGGHKHYWWPTWYPATGTTVTYKSNTGSGTDIAFNDNVTYTCQHN